VQWFAPDGLHLPVRSIEIFRGTAAIFTLATLVLALLAALEISMRPMRGMSVWRRGSIVKTEREALASDEQVLEYQSSGTRTQAPELEYQSLMRTGSAYS